MTDRLLREQERQDIVTRHILGYITDADMVLNTAKAQDAKTSAAIIKWLDEPCTKHPFEPVYWKPNPIIVYPSHRIECFQCWQELNDHVKGTEYLKER
jgi:hypothetical protein